MVDESGKQIVVITGITGFLGSTVAQKILKTKPEWKIRGVIRNPDNERKIEPLKKMWGDKFSDVEIVKGDLLDIESLKSAT